MKKTVFLTALLLLPLSGCIGLIAIRTVGGIMDYGFEAVFEEQDLQLAEQAVASNLKLIEALVKGDPENEKLLLLASQGYTSYASSFVEDISEERARIFYLRAKEYGMQALKKNTSVVEALDKDIVSLEKELSKLSKNDVPAVFWTAFAWGGYVNITRTDPGAVADIPKVIAMMECVLKNDSTFFYGGAHLFIGSILGSTPEMLGGKPALAKQNFEKCISINKGKFLLANVYYAKTYAVQVQDRELFEKLLNEVMVFNLDEAPKIRLPNAVAKKKAKGLLENVENYF